MYFIYACQRYDLKELFEKEMQSIKMFEGTLVEEFTNDMLNAHARGDNRQRAMY